MRQLVWYTKYRVSFYLWLFGSILSHCKVSQYYDQDCLNILFLVSALPVMIQISGNMLIWIKEVSLRKEIPVRNGESFLESIFDQK